MKRLALILFPAVCAVFAQTVGFECLRFDDPDYTFRNPFVAGGLSWANVRAAFLDARHGGIWMPLTWLSYMLERTLFGTGAGAAHAVSVLFHAANAVLLFLLARRTAGGSLSRKGLCALFAAVLFWALHPQRVEAVAWIASRKELLWAFFTLLGLLAWQRGRRALGLLACAAACCSKPTALVFPFLAALLAWDSATGVRRPTPDVRLSSVFSPALLLALVPSLLTGALAVFSQTHPAGMAAKDLFYAGFASRLLNAAVALGLYVFQLVVPAGLHLDYRAVPGFPLHGVQGLSALAACVAGIACLARVLRRRGAARVLWIPLAWFLAALAPTLGLFASFGEHARADRFLYVPAMALPLALALALRYVTALRRARPAAPSPSPKGFSFFIFHFPFFLLLSLPVLFLPVTCSLVASYRNDFTAFARTLACDPEHGRALQHVGSEWCARFHDLGKGIGFLRHSQRVRPRDGTAGELAFALATRGRREDVPEIRALGAAVAAAPQRDRKGLMLEALGMAALKEGRWADAIRFLAAAVRAPARLYPADDACARLGVALANAGRRAEAERLFAQLVKAPAVRPSVKTFAEQSLDRLSDGSSRVRLFY